MNDINWGFVQTAVILIGVPSLSTLTLFLWRQYNVRKARINRIRISYEIGRFEYHDNNGILFRLVNNSNYTLRNLKPSIKILKRYGDYSVSGLGVWENYKDFKPDEYAPFMPDKQESFVVSYLELARFLGGGESLRSQFVSTVRNTQVRQNWSNFEKPHLLITLFWPKPVTLLIELTYSIDDKGFLTEKHIFSFRCRFAETLEIEDLSSAQLAACGELVPLKTPIWLVRWDWFGRLFPYENRHLFRLRTLELFLVLWIFYMLITVLVVIILSLFITPPSQ